MRQICGTIIRLAKLNIAVAVGLSACTAFAAFAQRGNAGIEKPASQPRLQLVLMPHATDGSVNYIDVTLAIGQPRVKAGATLLRMALIVASIPTPRYDADAITASDYSGSLPLTIKDEPPTPSGIYRQWLAERDTVGDVTVKYRAPMRAVSASTRPGPLFDLRAESGGLNGAGLAFLALPKTENS